MEFIKKTNILVKTERRFVVKRQTVSEPVVQCEQCAGQMMLTQAAADFFNVSSRVIYRLIEQENVHFAETEINEIYICAASIREALKTIE